MAVLAALAPCQKYAQRNVSIRAGVLLLDSQQTAGVPSNYSPYVWYNLDSNRNVKPAGWNFYNPVANTRMTAAIAARWLTIDTALGYSALPGYVAPVDGDPVTKADAAYWEVRLSQASDAQITSFDVLHLSAYGAIQLNPLEQEKLRKFMEGGGVLWVDLKSGFGLNLDPINLTPLGFGVTTTSSATPATADFLHPLLSVPNTVSFDSLYAMQSEAVYGLKSIDLAALGFPDLIPIQGPSQFDSGRLLPIASDNLGPAIAVGQVGDGFMVVTSRGVATTLNRTWLNPGAPVLEPNRAHRSYEPQFDRTSDAAGRLVVNMANLTSSHSQTAKGSRKSNSTPIDVSAPLLKRFDQDLDIPSQNHDYFPPVIFQGLAVVTAGNKIVVYDANPSTDLDGDGNPDDGVPDLSLGASVDKLWEYTIGSESQLSAPACAEVADAPAGLRQQIAVTGASGNLYIFDAFPPGFVPAAPTTISPPAGTSPADSSLYGRGPYAPSYHDGLIFVTDEVNTGLAGIRGRVWVANAASGTAMTSAGQWQAGGTLSLNVPRPSAGAAIGYIPIADNSGGVDRVVYIPTRPNPADISPNGAAGVTSLWLGVKGEKPTMISPAGTQLVVTTRASGQGLRVYTGGGSLGVRLTILDPAGKPLDAATMNSRFDGTFSEANGILTFNTRGGAPLLPNETVRVDYTIDWGTTDANVTNQLLRGQLFLPDDSQHTKRILHNLALSPQGTLHLVLSNQTAPIENDFAVPLASRGGGAFYSFREEGRGSFKLLNRYELYPAHTFTLNQSSPTTIPETLGDNDGLASVATAAMGGNAWLEGRFTGLTYEGGPSILNGVVYVTARGYKSNMIPCSILMAFQADPDIPQIAVGDLSGGSFTILQPDISRSTNKTLPDQYSTLQPTQYVYEREPGSDRGTIRLDNLMSTTRGAVINAISRSQPIIIRRAGQPDQLIEPDRGSRWNPMLWYSVHYGIANQSPPTTTGKTVFLAGNSALPYIIQNWGGFSGLKFTGLLVGQDGDISPTDQFLVDDTSNASYPRSWLKQLIQMKTAPLQANEEFRWPQTKGVNSFEAWAVRLLQTTLHSSTGDKTDASGVVAGDGVLLSWAGNNAGGGTTGGIFGFSRADFVVADEGRLGRFDPAGNPIWATDAALLTGTSLDVGSAADVKPLIRPTRAYPVGNRDLLVADAGADRVVRLDAAGRELRAIDKIKLWTDTGGNIYTPDGFLPNEPLTLKSPRDVISYTTYVLAAANPYADAQPLEYWVHYVIADSANKRIVELLDRYAANVATRRNEGVVQNAAGDKALGVLYWHSPSSFSGKNFTYSSLARVYVDDPVTPRWVYAAGIGSALPTRIDTGLDSPAAGKPREAEGGNGGIVIFDGANSQVINEVTVPAIPANVLYNPATGLFDAPGKPIRDASVGTGKLLSNLSSVAMRNIQHPVYGNRVAIMFTDAEGVFEIVQPTAGGPWVVEWMLPRDVYKAMRHTLNSNVISGLSPADFRPYYARRLDSGEVLVVNGYFGTLRGSNAPFNGEVIQVDGDLDASGTQPLGFNLNKVNLGFQIFSIRFELPPISGARGLVIPVFADRR